MNRKIIPFIIVLTLLDLGCVNNPRFGKQLSSPEGIPVKYELPDREVDSISLFLKRRLGFQYSDVYAEVFLISMGEESMLMSYAFARNSMNYHGLATVGRGRITHSRVASMEPRSEWSDIESRFFCSEIFELSDDLSRDTFPKVVDGTAVFIRLYKNGAEIKRAFFYSPWARSNEQEVVIADAVSYLINHIALK